MLKLAQNKMGESLQKMKFDNLPNNFEKEIMEKMAKNDNSDLIDHR